jgi:hypothetical protein
VKLLIRDSSLLTAIRVLPTWTKRAETRSSDIASNARRMPKLFMRSSPWKPSMVRLDRRRSTDRSSGVREFMRQSKNCNVRIGSPADGITLLPSGRRRELHGSNT